MLKWSSVWRKYVLWSPFIKERILGIVPFQGERTWWSPSLLWKYLAEFLSKVKILGLVPLWGINVKQYLAVKKGCYLYINISEISWFWGQNYRCYLYMGVTYTRVIIMVCFCLGCTNLVTGDWLSGCTSCLFVGDTSVGKQFGPHPWVGVTLCGGGG